MKSVLEDIKQPLVSVIIPAFNRAKLLPRAIESVLKQTYSRIEIIVIDDGSTDDTKAVLEEYSSFITYYWTDHKGAANARNTGMKKANGEYLAFLDSDDVYLPYKLALQIDFITHHPSVKMVCTEFSGQYENGVLDEYYMKTYHNIWQYKKWRYEDVFNENKGVFTTSVVNKPINFYEGNIFKYVIQDSLIPSNTILFHKDILDVVGYQNIEYRYAQEYEFVVRICKFFNVAFLDISTYVLHIHDGQSTAFYTQKNKEKIDYLKEITMCSVQKKTIKDWAYNDKKFYNVNKELVDNCLKEINFFIGKLWLRCSDRHKALRYFKLSYSYGMKDIKLFCFLSLCFLPKKITKFILDLKLNSF